MGEKGRQLKKRSNADTEQLNNYKKEFIDLSISLVMVT